MKKIPGVSDRGLDERPRGGRRPTPRGAIIPVHLDHHRAFSVDYDLASHFDNSEVTLNIHLAGGLGLQLLGEKYLSGLSTPILVPNNVVGTAVIHLGDERNSMVVAIPL